MVDKKKWVIVFATISGLMLVMISLFNIIVDPFMHYRGGQSFLEYPLKDERYVNDGAQRHYDYNIMITGTSMSWNFNPSYVEKLAGKRTIKTAYSGATFHELGQSMTRAISHNNNLDTIICSFDPNRLANDEKTDTYEGYPTYLYDNNIFNDVNYIFNKNVITNSIAVINYTRSGQTTTSMDEYGRFDTYLPCGKDAVMASYERAEISDYSKELSDLDKEIIYKNISNNLIEVAINNPQVQFDYYIPPYSYCYWDALVRTNQMDYVIECEKYAVSLLLDCENINVYAFDDWTDVTTNLDYYMDTLHYNGVICDKIADSIINDTKKLKKDNYITYFSNIKKLYMDMEYDF